MNHVRSHRCQVRGRDGYGFPRWVTELDVEIDDQRTNARVANDRGETDVSLSASTRAPRHLDLQLGKGRVSDAGAATR